MQKLEWRKVLKFIFAMIAATSWLMFVIRGVATLQMPTITVLDLVKLISDALAACIWTIVVALYKVKK